MWLNKDWENFEPYQMKNNEAEHNYQIKVFVTPKTFVFELCQFNKSRHCFDSVF